ncbi:MAG: integrase family protein [Geminicoccaceae bacterium]|nr:integrase family protein [Geminicoccaceae bacterium]
MARTVADRNLGTREARRRLAARRKPYWRPIERGLHVGYYKGSRGGRWIARRYCGEGRYHETVVGTADDVLDADGRAILDFDQAQAGAREWFHAEVRRAAGEAPEAGPFTVSQVLDTYLKWYALHRKALVGTRSAIEAHIRPALGELEVVKLTTATIRRWHDQLPGQPARVRTRRGEAPRHREAPDAPEAQRARRSTANRLLTVLKAALNHVWTHPPKDHEAAVAAFDPEAWRKVKPFRGVDAARVRYLQAEECRRLLNACPPDFRALVRGALASGCRYGELARLEVRDFNRDAATLLVPESKSGKPRHVPLDDEAAAFLEAITAGRPGNERIFRRANGGGWGKSHQARPLLVACLAARIEPAANFHCLRHTWASHRVMKGAPMMVVAHVLGHADTRMVDKHYGHLAPSYVRDIVRATAMELGTHEINVTPLRPAAG